jgi:hypothetical protein
MALYADVFMIFSRKIISSGLLNTQPNCIQLNKEQHVTSSYASTTKFYTAIHLRD